MPTNYYPDLNSIVLERFFLEKHKTAGSLDPKQHVYTIDDIEFLMRNYGHHICQEVLRRKATEKNMRDAVTRIHKNLLKPAVNNYKKLNKTP